MFEVDNEVLYGFRLHFHLILGTEKIVIKIHSP